MNLSPYILFSGGAMIKNKPSLMAAGMVLLFLYDAAMALDHSLAVLQNKKESLPS
jgi:hypothetical protein